MEREENQLSLKCLALSIFDLIYTIAKSELNHFIQEFGISSSPLAANDANNSMCNSSEVLTNFNRETITTASYNGPQAKSTHGTERLELYPRW